MEGEYRVARWEESVGDCMENRKGCAKTAQGRLYSRHRCLCVLAAVGQAVERELSPAFSCCALVSLRPRPRLESLAYC